MLQSEEITECLSLFSMEDFHFEAETLMFQEAALNSDPDMGKLRVSLPVYSSLNMLNTITGALVQ